MPSFASVLDAAGRGDGRAFAQLYTILNRRVHAFGRARGAADPEGLVNEVFLRVFTSLSTFEGTEAQFTAWVFKIARNQLIDESRRRQRRPVEIAADSGAADRLSAPDDVEETVIGHLGSASVLRHLEELTADQRDVVLLRIVSDLTIDMIAVVLGKPPGAVKALQRRAFRTIARNLAPEAVPL